MLGKSADASKGCGRSSVSEGLLPGMRTLPKLSTLPSTVRGGCRNKRLAFLQSKIIRKRLGLPGTLFFNTKKTPLITETESVKWINPQSNISRT